MHKMGALIWNEWLKLYKKRSFFVPYAVMACYIGFAVFVVVKKYYEPGSAFAFMDDFASMRFAGQLLPIVAIIAIANVVPMEFRLGTIKLLLIRSQSRNKILASKFIVTLLHSFSLILALFAMAFACGLTLYGFGPFDWAAVARNMLDLAAYTFIYAALTFMVGVLTKSSGATVGISMFCLMIGSLVTMLLSQYSFAKFLLFPNADLSVYRNGGQPMLEGMSLPFSAAVLAAYAVVFMAASFVTFRNRDVS